MLDYSHTINFVIAYLPLPLLFSIEMSSNHKSKNGQKVIKIYSLVIKYQHLEYLLPLPHTFVTLFVFVGIRLLDGFEQFTVFPLRI